MDRSEHNRANSIRQGKYMTKNPHALSIHETQQDKHRIHRGPPIYIGSY